MRVTETHSSFMQTLSVSLSLLVGCIASLSMPLRGSDVFHPRPRQQRWKCLQPSFTQDLEQMRQIVLKKEGKKENIFTKDQDSPKTLSGPALFRGTGGFVAISWLNHNKWMLSHCQKNILLCGHPIKLNRVVKLNDGNSGCWFRLRKRQKSAQNILLPCLPTESIGCGRDWAAEEFLCYGACVSTLNITV